MVSPDLLKKGIKEGIIEPSDNIPKFTYDSMCRIRGNTAEHRLGYALEHSNLDYLTNYLEEVNSMEKVISYGRCKNHHHNFLPKVSFLFILVHL